MKKLIMKTVIRARFARTSMEKAAGQVRSEGERTLKLVRSVSEAEAVWPVRVPAMRGVDEDMRGWSLCMLLEHNTIVTRELTRIMAGLARGETVERRLDPKADVMPSAAPGLEQIGAFLAAIEEHLGAVDTHQPSKGTDTFPHPIFGDLDAHGFNCMNGLHLEIHRKQAEAIVKALQSPA